MSPMITALALTCESEAKEVLYALAKDLAPTDRTYQRTLEKVTTKHLIPWLGTVDSLRFFVLLPAYPTCADPHLTTLNSSFTHSNPTVEVDGRPLIDFKLCSKVADQIELLVQYSPPRVHHTTRPDVLTYVEYSLKSRRGDDMRVAQERSSNLAGKERSLLEHRQRVRSLGFVWSPRRK
jgi:hypothetical protein